MNKLKIKDIIFSHDIFIIYVYQEAIRIKVNGDRVEFGEIRLFQIVYSN